MIEFISVTKCYPDGVTAVSEVNLRFPAHETTVLVGPSGCGKTTMLRMINRLEDPTEGLIEIDGENIAKSDAVQLRRSIGYVLQNGGLLPHLRVLDNIAQILRLKKTPKKQAYEKSLELMDLVGLDRGLAQRYPAQLSGGQQQRVGVARALSADPNILLMDEPFAAVDPVVRVELQTEVKRLQSELRKTIVFVTHDIDEAFLLGDQVVILGEGGHIHQAASPAEILSNPADDFVTNFVGLSGGRRSLRAQRCADGTTVLIDGDGLTRGVLVDDGDQP